MKKRNFLLSVLLVCGMISPFHANAEGAETIQIPRHPMLPYDVAKLTVAYGKEFSGSTISVYRIQDEGEFLYYTYDTDWTDETEVEFLLKEGDYCLMAKIPSADSVERITFELLFTIDDPDMDETQSFDRTEMYVRLNCDDTIAEDMLNMPEQEIHSRIIEKSASYTMARRKIAVGNLENDDDVNAKDASLILQCCAEIGAGGASSFTALQVLEADVDKNGVCNAEDAAIILRYTAEVAAGNYIKDFESYISELSLTPEMPKE